MSDLEAGRIHKEMEDLDFDRSLQELIDFFIQYLAYSRNFGN
jgi:hypothetical protein